MSYLPRSSRMLAPLLLIGLLACKKEPGMTSVITPPVLTPAPTFTNPLLPSGPDPWVVQKDGV